jgi:hypothetical protein
MTPQTYARLAELIANPPPGSKLAAAKEYGIDLTLLLSSLERNRTSRNSLRNSHIFRRAATRR